MSTNTPATTTKPHARSRTKGGKAEDKTPEHIHISYVSIGGVDIDMSAFVGRLGGLAFALDEIRKQAEGEGFTGLAERLEGLANGFAALFPDTDAMPPDPVTQARMFLIEERRRAQALLAGADELAEAQALPDKNKNFRMIREDLKLVHKILDNHTVAFFRLCQSGRQSQALMLEKINQHAQRCQSHVKAALDELREANRFAIMLDDMPQSGGYVTTLVGGAV